MADMLTNRLSRWIKGVSVKPVNFIAPEEGGDVRAAKVAKAEKNTVAALGEIADGKPYGILHNEKYGEIQYPLGRSGKGGMGFLHIVERRMNDGASLNEAIEIARKVGVAAEIGKETASKMNTRWLDYDNVRAIIALTNDGTPIITGYEIRADKLSGAYPSAENHQPQPLERKEAVVAALKNILAQSSESINPEDNDIRYLRQARRHEDG